MRGFFACREGAQENCLLSNNWALEYRCGHFYNSIKDTCAKIRKGTHGLFKLLPKCYSPRLVAHQKETWARHKNTNKAIGLRQLERSLHERQGKFRRGPRIEFLHRLLRRRGAIPKGRVHKDYVELL